MVDPFDDLTDVRMPESGTEGHVTLLLASTWRGTSTARPSMSCTNTSASRPPSTGATGARRRGAGAEVELTQRALSRLTALRLVSHRADERQVRALPALARYALLEPTIGGPA